MFKVYNKLLYYVPGKRYLACIAITVTAISTFLTVGAYYYLNAFLKQLIVVGDIGQAKDYAFVIVSLLIIGSVLYLGAVLVTHALGFRLETNLRKRGIDGLASASFRFFDLNSSGKTRRIIDDNAAQTHMIVAHLIPDIAGAVLTPLLILILGFLVDVKVGVILSILALLSLLLMTLMMGNKNFMKIYQEALEKLSSETVEYIRGIQVVKIFEANVASFKTLHAAITDYSKFALNYSMGCKTPYVLFQMLMFGFTAILIPFIVLFMNAHEHPRLLVVWLIMTLLLGGVLFTTMMKIMYVSMYSFLGVSAVDKLEILFEEMQKDRLEFGNLKHFKNFDIEFDSVCFGYGNKRVLDSLSFKLEENKRYALVGASGSGKSTIARLISGFYKPDGGEIRIGGENINNYNEKAIMKHIAFVFQTTRLFKNSIYENVKIGNPSASDDVIEKALHLAGCDSIIKKFPQGKHTVIGANGIFLSGGEKQRIAIARAILKDADIIILDEASAAIDPENEYELQKAFSNLMKGKTVIMIAHRLSSIRKVDEILVMEAGRIIQRGTDKELMAQDGKYKEFQTLYGKANDWRVRYE
ncbi:ABC transporter ATP-binding protein [Salmonella enterica subsp. enterica serovar Newport]|nr:ABC transporter ATP-binding protein [Salmonella enterica subsp. enterica serovar Newport]